MCGIVGYIGDDKATPILLNGLEKLEYRGYDSAGVAVYQNHSVEVVKSKGRLKIYEHPYFRQSYDRNFGNWSYTLGYPW